MASNFLYFGFSILLMAGCSGESGGGHTQEQIDIQTTDGDALVGQVEAPTDYSKIKCGSINECETVCDTLYPAAPEEEIRELVCSDTFSVSVCNAIVRYHDEGFLPSNLWCRDMSVTEVMAPESLESDTCSTDFECFQECNRQFIPEDDRAIERAAAANGGRHSSGTLKALLRNHLVKIQLQGCMDAPAGYILEN